MSYEHPHPSDSILFALIQNVTDLLAGSQVWEENEMKFITALPGAKPTPVPAAAPTPVPVKRSTKPTRRPKSSPNPSPKPSRKPTRRPRPTRSPKPVTPPTCNCGPGEGFYPTISGPEPFCRLCPFYNGYRGVSGKGECNCRFCEAGYRPNSDYSACVLIETPPTCNCGAGEGLYQTISGPELFCRLCPPSNGYRGVSGKGECNCRNCEAGYRPNSDYSDCILAD
jgi:hypothetical protein